MIFDHLRVRLYRTLAAECRTARLADIEVIREPVNLFSRADPIDLLNAYWSVDGRRVHWGAPTKEVVGQWDDGKEAGIVEMYAAQLRVARSIAWG